MKLKRMGHVVGVSLAAGVLALCAGMPSPVAAAQGGVKVGVLSCNVAGGWGLIFGSSKDVNCTFEPQQGQTERYRGQIAKFGADIGYSKAGVMIWGVWAPTSDIAGKALAGTYTGVSGQAAVGVGAGANVLVGGFNKSVTLQPVSIEGSIGLNVAAGVTSLTLQASQ